MPQDPFAAYQKPAAATGSDPFAAYQKPADKPTESALSRFGSGLWDTTLGGLGQAAKMMYHLTTANPGGIPNLDAINDVHNVIQSHVDQANKARDSWQQGNKVEALGHGLAAAVPLVGPAAAHAGERIGGSAPVFDKYGSVVTPGQAPDIAGGIGEGAGLIVSSSPENIVKPAVGAAVKAAGKVPVPHRITPEGLYQSALRPSLAKRNLPKVDSQVATGLREGIPVDSGGLEKVGSVTDDINAEIADKIKAKSDELGPVISPSDVAQRTAGTRSTFGNQVNPNADVASVNRATQEFLDKHSADAPYTQIEPHKWTAAGENPDLPQFYKTGEGSTKVEQPLTLSDAQSEKQGTYQQLRKKYGEMGSADVEAQKSLARGLKEEIVKRVPELADLNARDGALIELEGQLEKMVAREGNKNVLGLVPATMAHNPYGFLATLMMDNPAIKSRIAIALDRARKVNVSGGAANAAGVAAPASAASVGAGQQDQLPHFAKGGLIKRPTYLVDAATNQPTGIMAEAGPEAIVPLGPPPARTALTPPQVKLHLQHKAPSGKQRAAVFEAMRHKGGSIPPRVNLGLR